MYDRREYRAGLNLQTSSWQGPPHRRTTTAALPDHHSCTAGPPQLHRRSYTTTPPQAVRIPERGADCDFAFSHFFKGSQANFWAPTLPTNSHAIRDASAPKFPTPKMFPAYRLNSQLPPFPSWETKTLCTCTTAVVRLFIVPLLRSKIAGAVRRDGDTDATEQQGDSG